MTTVKDNCLEWSLNHLKKYYDSDFYPKLFEFKAIAHNWQNVKDHILAIDLDNYVPASPIINLAPKANSTYRVIHQLDPIDSLIYTSLVYELSGIIEEYRIPEAENIACSYRIKPTVEGSFFDEHDNGWGNYLKQLDQLIQRFKGGYVLFCDITDFYNQIYTHRIQNIVAEAGKGEFDEKSKVLEKFLLDLNKNTSRGIPVGPAPSIVLAESIMSDIDRKILHFTRDFVRWVDDIRIFFDTKEEATTLMYELSKYLYSSHRLVLSGEKTKIETTNKFVTYYFNNEEREEQKAILSEVDDLAQEKIDEIYEEMRKQFGPYDLDETDIDFDEIYNEVLEKDKVMVFSNAYKKLLEMNLKKETIDVQMLRYMLRKATSLRIRSLMPIILSNFEKLLPVVREVILYLNKLFNKDNVKYYIAELQAIIGSYYMRFPFINHWVAYLLQNDCFNGVNIPADYDSIISSRDKALIALRNNDLSWIKDYKDHIDTLGVWDKRAVLYSSKMLSFDERQKWLNTVSARGDIIDKSLSSYVISFKK
jgi:hypothetical protein